MKNSIKKDKKALISKLVIAQEELNKEIAMINRNGGASGFGGGAEALKEIHFYIDQKQNEVKLLNESLNHLRLQEAARSSNYAAWLSATTAFLALIVAITNIFIHH